VSFVNHAIVNPPIDRDRPLDEVKDVYMHVVKETDGGLVVSGAKVVATTSSPTACCPSRPGRSRSCASCRRAPTA
jgi:4-hydroxyphenylacetate 3-monooxygenase